MGAHGPSAGLAESLRDSSSGRWAGLDSLKNPPSHGRVTAGSFSALHTDTLFGRPEGYLPRVRICMSYELVAKCHRVISTPLIDQPGHRVSRSQEEKRRPRQGGKRTAPTQRKVAVGGHDLGVHTSTYIPIPSGLPSDLPKRVSLLFCEYFLCEKTEASSDGKVGVWLDVGCMWWGGVCTWGVGRAQETGQHGEGPGPGCGAGSGAAAGPVSCWDQQEFLKVPGSRKRGGTIVPSNLKPRYCLIVFLKNSPAISTTQERVSVKLRFLQ